MGRRIRKIMKMENGRKGEREKNKKERAEGGKGTGTNTLAY